MSKLMGDQGSRRPPYEFTRDIGCLILGADIGYQAPVGHWVPGTNGTVAMS